MQANNGVGDGWRGERVDCLRVPLCFTCGVADIVVEANSVSLAPADELYFCGGRAPRPDSFPVVPRRQTGNPSFESEAWRSPPSLLSEWVCWIVFRVKKKLTLAGELGFYFVLLFSFY